MLEVKGMDELVKKLEQIANAPKKASTKALNQAGSHVQKIEKKVAKERHDKYSEDVGNKEIKKHGVKTYKSGRKYIDIGLKVKLTESAKKKEAKDRAKGVARASYWDKVRGLYFNHYGFFHNRTGEYIAGSGWMNEAYDQSIDEAYSIIRNVLVKEMGL